MSANHELEGGGAQKGRGEEEETSGDEEGNGKGRSEVDDRVASAPLVAGGVEATRSPAAGG